MTSNNSALIETERLLIRKYSDGDINELSALMSDPEVMEYYPAVLSRQEAEERLEGILGKYETVGFSWWAVILKETGEFIGQAGIIRRELEPKDERNLLGYMFKKEFWHHGYATEAARAVIDYGLSVLGLDRIDCNIRPENTPSLAVAKRLELTYERNLQYFGFEHELYFVERSPNGSRES
jgi:[ribosomal protein S5]-alanine N-acetyltransferase